MRRENPNIYSRRAPFVCADSTRLLNDSCARERSEKKGGFAHRAFFAAAAAGEQLCAQYRLVTEDDYG